MNITLYTKNDEKHILDLFELAFKQKMSEEYWNWRFINNPFIGMDNPIYLMWDDKKLIGHYAVSPVEMKIENKIHKTALSMTTMTHPNYGGKGIFSSLAECLYQDLKDKNYSMVWGFPNNNSHYGFIKRLGWKDISIVPMFSLKAIILKKIKIIKDFELIDAISNSISSKLNNCNSISINKTVDYLNWRYCNNPVEDYKIVKSTDDSIILVYKVIPSFVNSESFEIDLMELYVENLEVNIINQLLLFVLELEEKKIDKFNIWSPLSNVKHVFLEKLGFRMDKPLTYFGYKNLNLENNELVISNISSWDLNMSYSDVF